MVGVVVVMVVVVVMMGEGMVIGENLHSLQHHHRHAQTTPAATITIQMASVIRGQHHHHATHLGTPGLEQRHHISEATQGGQEQRRLAKL